MSTERTPIRLADYRPPAFRIDRVELTFDLDPDRTVVSARLQFAANRSGEALRLDGEDLILRGIALDGTPLAETAYQVETGALTIFNVPSRGVLEIVTEIAPAANTRLEGLYRSGAAYCTQCEAEGFRRITYFLDRPDVMAVYRVTIRADCRANPILLSNGNRVAAGDLDDGRHFAVWEDPFPKPCYLFALVAGDLAQVADRFTTRSGRSVDLNIWVEHGNERLCGYAMDALKRSMRWDEDVYGLEYDLNQFNIVAVSDFNMGAMENKSLNLFNTKYVLADPDTATDADYAGIEAVIAHEYFHNWTGNRVTCRDWFQLSLKEGLTVFRDQQFSADMRSAPVKRISDVRALRARQFQEDAGPLVHPVRPESYVEINNFYTATVYEKGAEVIRMMELVLGRAAYRRGIDLYFQRHDGQAVTCDDFAQAMADASGIDLTQFKLWYSQAGTPKVTARWSRAADGALMLDLMQTRRAVPGEINPKPMDIPLAVAMVAPDGGVSGAQVVRLRAPVMTVRWPDAPAAAVPSINRGFSAPILLEADYRAADLALLMAHDDDPFNRWEAGNEFSTRLLLDRIAGRDVTTDASALLDALARNLGSATDDPAFAAQMFALPSSDYVADRMAVVDVEGVHSAREWLRRSIATRAKDRWHDLYAALKANAPYSPDAAPAGRRALRNLALWYLSALDQPDSAGLAARQFDAADNMTDRLAALNVLVEQGGDAAEAALAGFHRRFQGDALVIDKWFAVQAASPAADTLARVRRLLTHADFSYRNPNKVRALIGGFAGTNPLRFHAADGAGYDFLAEQAILLDPVNPQIAARLLPPLCRWRRFDPARQALMKAALIRVRDRVGVSPDVGEIVDRALAEP